MKISNTSAGPARWFNTLGGLALAVVGGGFLYLQLPDLFAGTASPLVAVLPMIVALSGLVFSVRAATLARHEWIIGDTYLRVRTKRDPDVLIYPNQFETLERQTYELGGDRDNGLPCVALIVGLTDGRVFESPRMFDDAVITRAWRKLEALQSRRTRD